MPTGSNFDTSRFIELDGTVEENFPFGNGWELFNPCKATDPMMENIYGELKISSPIFS